MAESERKDVFEACFDDEAGGIVSDGRAREEIPEGGETAEAGEEAPEAPLGERIPGGEARERDLRQFVLEFPGVMPEDVPPQVMERALRGESLVTAYMRHQNGELRRENRRLLEGARARERSERNRSRAAGSQRSAGTGETGRDAFDEGWYGAW